MARAMSLGYFDFVQIVQCVPSGLQLFLESAIA